MSKEIYISSTPHETRLAIVENDNLAEMYYERENEYTLAGSIYNGKVTRVLPGMQSSFVDIGLERDAFLYITDFMEEAGDTADFEAAANDSGSARAGNGRGEGASRERQQRDMPPSDSELFTQAVSDLDPARPAIINASSSEKGPERGRRGGRNRNNRGGNRQENPRTLPGGPESVRTADPGEALTGNIAIPDLPEQVGEGLPGADGSRRWFGRRGRRGNRSAASAPQSETLSQPEASTSESLASDPHETSPFFDADASPEVYGGYNSQGNHLDLKATGSTPATAAEPHNRSGRNGRDRNRPEHANRQGGGAQDSRSDRPAPASRAPRGFAPSTDLYKVDPPETRYGVEPEVDPPMEPIILPGESLAKYKTGSSATPAAEPPRTSTATADSFVVQGWDGGFVLPGETLRPRNPALAQQRNAGSGSPISGERDRGSRNRKWDKQEPRAPRNDVQHDQQAPSTATELKRDEDLTETASPSEPTYLTEPEHVPPSHLITSIDSTFVPPPPVPHLQESRREPSTLLEAPILGESAIIAASPEEVASSDQGEELEFVETQDEYEPLDASASYRLDPIAPQEFRQSAPVLEPEPASESPEESTPEPEYIAAVNIPGELLNEAPAYNSPEAHEITSLSDSGDLHSSPPADSLHQQLPDEEVAPASVPAPHGVVDNVISTQLSLASSSQNFEPGSGVLEEEMLDDGDGEEEGIVPALHAHTQLDFEHAEQESIENGADLGVMLREMSIDQITGTEPSLNLGDEDDFEENFLEEDQDFDSEETEESSLEDVHEPVDGFSSTEEPQEALEEDSAELDSRAQGESSGEANGRRRDPRESSRRDSRSSRPERSRRAHPGERSSLNSSPDRSRRDNGHRGRPSMQSTNLPAISDLLKPGQEILVQIAKEPMAKKGARITSHIALPGRFLVFMPTVSHTGVSRKIESDSERRRLKEILLSEKGDASGGFIVRTAASGATEQELRSDLRFLLNLWADIKSRSESSKSPALIYHDLNLIERVLRDQVTDNFSAIWVDSETEYERVLRFLQRFQPSLIRRVKLYTKETPLFEQFGITEEINKALRSKVWLKSGGSIVINQTEALVAIDINTGKFVGKTARLEDTIVKTNLDAIPEIVRQIRLRDLGGIIIIDFIDMDERKNRNKVMAALEEELKSDRAPSKVLQFNDFGLVAITRKRVKQSLERTLSTTCNICQGTGMTKSPVTICNDIYVEMRKMSKHLDRGDVMLRVHPEVVKQLKAPSTHWLQEMEEMVGKTILIKSDPSLHPEQFDIH